MFKKGNLLLIVLTKSAKSKIDNIDIREDLDNLDNIQLFKLRRKNGSDWSVALPVDEGRYTLLLVRDKTEDYFVCVTVLTEETSPNQNNHFCHELPPNITCQIIEGKSAKKYASDSIDHSDVLDEVEKKKEWKPYASTNIEERKWETYLELYKRIIDEQKVSFFITGISLEKKKLTATLDDGLTNEEIEKIQAARGEDINFSLDVGGKRLPRLGKLVSVSNKQITINLNKEYEIELNTLINNFLSNFDYELTAKKLINPETIELKNNENKPVLKAKIKKLANTELSTETVSEALIGQKEKPVVNKNKQKSDEDVYELEKDSIELLGLHIVVEFFSDYYQIKVMKRSLEEIKKRDIWQVLSGERVAKLPQSVDLEFDNPQLNEEQKKAVKGALGASELFLIWGPPGTGKTEVIKEIAKHEALRGNKTLICSQSNLAVDNALSRLDDLPEVHPFRIAKNVYKMEGEDTQKVPFTDTSGKFYLKDLQNRLKEKQQPSTDDPLHNLQRQFLKRLEKSIKTHDKKNKSETELREFKQHAELYKNNINVVGTTLMEAGKLQKTNGKFINKLCNTTGIDEFDVVIIDEVSKATPPELFIPVSLGKCLILVGDHKQLPPMFKMLSGDDKTQEEWAKEANIDESELDIDSTIFERLWERHIDDASPVRAMLMQQYRMHPKIQSLIEPFYTDSEGTLSFGFGNDNNEAINRLVLKEIPFCKHRPTMWIGTRQDSLERKVGTSFVNDDEVKKVGKLLNILSEEKDKTLSVGVITFYGAQLRELRNEYERKFSQKFGDGKLIFGTVDRFQGRECDVIICSLVRNNKSRFIGFASKVNRINVAFSRARKSLIILGNKEQFCYESKDISAKNTYKTIYDKCDKPKPKELGKY